MLKLQDPAAVARDLTGELGLDGLVEAGRRAERCRRDGDAIGARFWTTVGHHMRIQADARAAAASGKASPSSALVDSAVWRLMQRVEHFRHRAMQCRARAEQAPEAQRGEMLEVEEYWLELATYAELLAGEPTRP